MPDHPRIAILVEHVARELDIACILKHRLAQDHGVEALVSGIYKLDCEKLEAYDPRAVVVPYFFTSRPHAELLRRLSREGRTFVNLNYEQLFHPLNLQRRAPQDVVARRHVLHAVWSQSFQRYLKGHGVPESHIAIVGNPALRLYRPPYSAYYRSREELAEQHGLDPQRRWVFVPDQWQKGLSTPDMVEALITSNGYTREQARSRYRFEQDSFIAVAKWWANAATAGAEVIVRPRPACPYDQYAHCVKHVLGRIPKRLHLIKAGTVREWILGSDVTTSSYSTSLIEAAVAGCEVAKLVPFPYPPYLYSDWLDHLPSISDETSFLGLATGTRRETSGSLQRWAEDELLPTGDPLVSLTKLLSLVAHGKRCVSCSPWAIQEVLGQEGQKSAPRRVGKGNARSLRRDTMGLLTGIPRIAGQALRTPYDLLRWLRIAASGGLSAATHPNPGISLPSWLVKRLQGESLQPPFGYTTEQMLRWGSQDVAFEADRVTPELVTQTTTRWAGLLNSG